MVLARRPRPRPDRLIVQRGQVVEPVLRLQRVVFARPCDVIVRRFAFRARPTRVVSGVDLWIVYTLSIYLYDVINAVYTI